MNATIERDWPRRSRASGSGRGAAPRSPRRRARRGGAARRGVRARRRVRGRRARARRRADEPLLRLVVKRSSPQFGRGGSTLGDTRARTPRRRRAPRATRSRAVPPPASSVFVCRHLALEALPRERARVHARVVSGERTPRRARARSRGARTSEASIPSMSPRSARLYCAHEGIARRAPRAIAGSRDGSPCGFRSAAFCGAPDSADCPRRRLVGSSAAREVARSRRGGARAAPLRARGCGGSTGSARRGARAARTACCRARTTRRSTGAAAAARGSPARAARRRRRRPPAAGRRRRPRRRRRRASCAAAPAVQQVVAPELEAVVAHAHDAHAVRELAELEPLDELGAVDELDDRDDARHVRQHAPELLLRARDAHERRHLPAPERARDHGDLDGQRLLRRAAVHERVERDVVAAAPVAQGRAADDVLEREHREHVP